MNALKRLRSLSNIEPVKQDRWVREALDTLCTGVEIEEGEG